MNEMRKLMEAVQLNEYFVKEGETFKDVWTVFFSDLVNDAKIFQDEGESEVARQFLAVSKDVAPLKQKIKPLLNTPLPVTDADGSDYWEEDPISMLDRLGDIVSSNDPAEDESVLNDVIESFYEAYSIIDDLADEALGVNEANQGGKTEHSGAKKGKGAYYGRKKEAKRDSNKNRRKADKAQTKDISEVTTADGYAYDIGTVNVRIIGDEVGLNHGHGENIFLTREEFHDFVQGLKHNKLGESEELSEAYPPREATVALHELMDEGMLDARSVADACLNYMSEAEVKDMAESNYFFGNE